MSFLRLLADPDSLPPALRDSFHEGVRAGDIDRLRQMLEQEPLLSLARTGEREPPLHLASVHPDAHKAVEMINFLLEKGAALGLRSSISARVAIACHHGVDWIVVECLLKWNASMGGGILKWSPGDNYANSPLVSACLGGHTQLALRLLDEIERDGMWAHHLRVLKDVIGLGNEANALAIAEHPKLQVALRAAGMQWHECYGLDDVKAFRGCVEAAVEREMASVVCLMDNLNHPTASKATWLAIVRLSTRRENAQSQYQHAVILGIAKQFEKDQRWEQVKGLFLLRYRGQNVDIGHGQLRADLLALLPDQLFRLVVEFIKRECFWGTSNPREGVNWSAPQR